MGGYCYPPFTHHFKYYRAAVVCNTQATRGYKIGSIKIFLTHGQLPKTKASHGFHHIFSVLSVVVFSASVSEQASGRKKKKKSPEINCENTKRRYQLKKSKRYNIWQLILHFPTENNNHNEERRKRESETQREKSCRAKPSRTTQ